MTILRDELAEYLDDYLSCGEYEDYAPNGLQIEGRSQIERVCTAVTASEEAIARAVEWKADALLVHHGYFWRGEDPRIRGVARRRVHHFLNHDISLFAYHLPLDCHLSLGNNASIADLLQLNEVKSHRVKKTPNLLWTGVFNQERSMEELLIVLNEKFQREPLGVSAGKHGVKRLAWCSGAAQDLIEQASEFEVDAYLSGEISERTYYQARELGVHYFSCGHHATERLGIQKLGQHLAKQFGLQHQFIDSANPV